MRAPRSPRSATARISAGLLILALGLAACQPQAPDGGEAQPPADAAAPLPTSPAPEATAPAPAAQGPYDGEMRAVGTEPFWGVRITETEITLERPDAPPSKGPNSGRSLEEGQAVWRTRTADGGDLMVTIWEEASSDGMSDLTYAYQARVQSGDESLSGCAGKADAMPREGQTAP